VLGLVPGVLFEPLAEIEPWAPAAPSGIGLDVPGTGALPTAAIALVLAGLVGALALARGSRSAAPAPSWACGQPVEPELQWTSAGFTKPLRLVLEVVLRPEREIAVRSSGGVVQEVSYTGRVPHLIEERIYGPITRAGLSAAAQARRLQTGRLSTYVAYLILTVVVVLAAARLGVIG
jgi:hydrogenase-4 component B